MISKKEMIAIYQIVLAVLCFFSFALYTWNIKYPFDLNIYAVQCTILATGIICLIFACGTWFYSSNFKTTRFHVRIFSFTVLLIFNVLLIIVVILVALPYLAGGDEIYGFEKDIWDDTLMVMLIIAIVLTIVVAVLMIPMNIFLLWKIIKKKKETA